MEAFGNFSRKNQRGKRHTKKTWTVENGKNKSLIGNYHIDGAYGGVNLHCIINESGAVNNVFGCGHVPKRDLWNRMRAFLEGCRK